MNNIFEIPIPERDHKKVAELIQYISKVSLKGGGKVPLLYILNVAGLDKKKGMRIQKMRGDLILKSEKGKLDGLFLNTGQKEKKIGGNFKVTKNRLDLSNIQGLTIFKTVGDNLFDLKFKVRKVVLTPKTVTVV